MPPTLNRHSGAFRLRDAETAAAAEEKQKLQQHFGRWDVLLYLVCTLVGVDTIGSAAKNGAEGFTWLLILGLTFFVPYALLTAELGSAFTDEGGPYVWVKLAFGRAAAGLTALLYWVSNPFWVGGALVVTAETAVGAFFTPLKGWAHWAFCLAFIWGTVVVAILSLRTGKWLPIAGAWARLLILPFFTITVVLYARTRGVHGFHLRDFAPSYVNFVALAPVLFFNYFGFELPSAAGEEMRDPQRDVPFAVARSGAGTLLLYGAPVLSILLVLRKDQMTGLGGFIDAIKAVFTVYGGHAGPHGSVVLSGAGELCGQITCLAFLVALASSGASWIMGADRILAVAAFDGAAPRALGRLSARFGTPVTVNILSGVVSTAVLVAATTLFKGDSSKYFQAGLGLTISTNTLAYLFIFPAFLRLRRRLPEAPRPYRVPGGAGTAWLCGSITTLWAAVAAIALLWPGVGVGWFGSKGTPDDSLPAGFGHQRLLYESTQLLPLFVLLLVSVLFYGLGRATRATLVQPGRSGAGDSTGDPEPGG